MACVLCAAVLTVAVALAGGAAGAARLGAVGANPWAVGGALLGELLLARPWWSAPRTCARGGLTRAEGRAAGGAAPAAGGSDRHAAQVGMAGRAPQVRAQPRRSPKLPSSSSWHVALATAVLAPARQSWRP